MRVLDEDLDGHHAVTLGAGESRCEMVYEIYGQRRYVICASKED
jgi:hypothetical protein